MTKIPLKLVALTLLNCAFLGLAAVVWRNGQDNIRQSERTPAHKLAMPDLAALNVKPTANDLGAIREDAVFYSRRSFYRAPSIQQAVSMPEYEFAGTMSLPQGKRVAFLKKIADQTTRTVHVGDDFDGWHVVAMDAVRVVVVREDQRYELKANAPSPIFGFIHGDPASRPVEAGTRVLGAEMATTVPLPQSQVATVRRYRPPPSP